MQQGDGNANSQQVQQLAILRFIRILRIMKLVRVFRASRIFARWKAHIELPIAIILLVKYSCIILMVAHWLACLWGLVPTLENSDGQSKDWMKEIDIRDSPGYETKYIASLYWSVMTIGTIGYGDVPVTTDTERLMCVLCMFIGCGVYSFSTLLVSHTNFRTTP